MRFISARLHGALDYITGMLLVASPWLFSFSEGLVATCTAVAAGIIVLGQAALTDFEVGLFKKTSVSTHLMTDAYVGIILAISPWPFGFDGEVYIPHLVFGLYFILAAFATHRIPSSSYQEAQVS